MKIDEMNSRSIGAKKHYWIRDECKNGERRSPLIPRDVQKLLLEGHFVTVEESTTRCIPNEAYQEVGCQIVPSGSWRTQAPHDAIILGIKHLPFDDMPITHQHVYFAHAFKKQEGWKELLTRFIRGGGLLYDMEYLTDDNGRRVATFGRAAGMVGMALGILSWCHQQLDPTSPLPSIDYFSAFKALEEYTSKMLAKAVAKTGRKPTVVIIGPHGRCGKGATHFASELDLQVDKWDITRTAIGGPFPKLLEHNILVNCIYLLQPIQPFLTRDLLEKTQPRSLSVVVDVSCDASHPYNPLPIYNETTSVQAPTRRIIHNGVPLDLVAVDHLPTIVPDESSTDFSAALVHHLLSGQETGMWNRTRQLFGEVAHPLRDDLRHIWLRDEQSETERRTPLTPQDARKLLEQGFQVTVEQSQKRVFADEEYSSVGCKLVASGSWKTEAPVTSTILGLGSLPNEDQSPLRHQHMYFGYCFKQQVGWRELLRRYVDAGGKLIDLEYLVDENNQRLCTFATIAGFIGMAAGILVWCHQQLHPQKMKRSRSKESLVQLATAETWITNT